jgi:hypothetical protein
MNLLHSSQSSSECKYASKQHAASVTWAGHQERDLAGSAVDTSEVEERRKWRGTEEHAATHPETGAAVAVAKPAAAPTGAAEEEEEDFCAAVSLAAAAAAVAKGKLCVGNRELDDQRSWFSTNRKRADRDASYLEWGCGKGGGERWDEAEEGDNCNDLQGTIGLLEDALCRCVCFCVCDCTVCA